MPADPPLPIHLHLGAHRTGTGALAALLRARSDAVARAGWAMWTPPQTRDGRLRGLLGDPSRPEDGRAFGRLALRRAELAEAGARRLLVCDPGLLGSPRECVALARLYPTARARLRRLSRATGPVARVTLCVRRLDGWWASVLADRARRGGPPPDMHLLDAVAGGDRGWRAVIEAVAEAMPEAAIDVWSWEGPLGGAAAGMAALTGVDGPAGTPLPAPVRSLPREIAWRLRMLHRSDMIWLRDGADGLVRYRGGDGAGREEGDEGHRRVEGPGGDVDRAGGGGTPGTPAR